MLRNVLLKAVQNLRRSQNREGRENAQRQEEQELQLPQPRLDMNEGELQYDIAIERINRIESTTNTLSKNDQTDPTSQGKDSYEKAAQGKKYSLVYQFLEVNLIRNVSLLTQISNIHMSFVTLFNLNVEVTVLLTESVADETDEAMFVASFAMFSSKSFL